jgi:TolB protein
VRPFAVLFSTFLICVFGTLATAQDPTVRITTEGRVDTRVTVAVPPFTAMAGSGLESEALEIAQACAADLAFTGLFKILPREEFPPTFQGFNADVSKENFDIWRPTKAEHVLYGVLTRKGNQLVGRFHLYDLFFKEQVLGLQLSVEVGGQRHLAHRLSEDIVKHFDGESGIATTSIVFSAGEKGSKEIYLADYDGANVRVVTQHNSISIKPKISPDGTKIAYLSYKDRYPYLYVYERLTGRSTPLSAEVGTNMTPAWSPDGKRIALTLSKDGNMEIYLVNSDGSNQKRLTKDRSLDSSPVFSPDGKSIGFVSTRGGSPQIWVMQSDGISQRRLSFQGGNSYDPSWAPNGKLIAYVVEKSGQGLEIYVMDANGKNARRLTDSAGSNESPTWSPDSRHIMFTSNRGGAPQLWSVNLASGEERPVARLRMSSQGPSWGPRRR